MKYTPKQIKDWDVQESIDGVSWHPARSLNHTCESFFSRIRNAWGVLTGRYDALDWQE